MSNYINEPWLVQIVTKASTHGEFKVGDILIPKKNGTIMTPMGGGWFEKDDIEDATKGMKTTIYREFYLKKIIKLKEEIDQCEAILRRANETPTP